MRVSVMMMMAALAIIAAACGGGKSSADKTSTAVAAPKTVAIQADGDGDGFDAFMIAYFPDTLTLHPGDSVKLTLKDSGEPHTFSTGGPIDDLVDFVYSYCGPEGFKNQDKCGPDVQPPPEIEQQFNDLFGKVPQLLPGQGDANQMAANPCFLASGALPEDAPCPEVDQPTFNGKQAFYSSGWLDPNKDFVVKLADDIAPGTYTFLCLLHGPEMLETIRVVDDSSPADTADDVSARRETQLQTFRDALTKPAADLAAFSGSDESGSQVNVQAEADAETVAAAVAEFGPDQLSVPVGATVTWQLHGNHTISFNAGEDVKSLRQTASDGTIHVNQDALNPAQVSIPPPPEEEPPPDAPPAVIDGGTWNGEGFLSTGGIGDGLFKLTFAQAGTYAYKCLIHDGMEGTIKVGT